MKADDFTVEYILSGKPSRMPLKHYERMRSRLPGTEAVDPREAWHAAGGTWTWVTVRLVQP